MSPRAKVCPSPSRMTLPLVIMQHLAFRSLKSRIIKVNPSPPKQKGHRFGRRQFEIIDFRFEFHWHLFPGVWPNNIKTTLVKVMTLCRTGDKPLLEPMLTQLIDAYMWHYMRWVKVSTSITININDVTQHYMIAINREWDWAVSLVIWVKHFLLFHNVSQLFTTLCHP